MLDHALGRPSPAFKRIQVLLTTLLLLSLAPSSLPFNRYLKHIAPSRIVLWTVTLLYVLKNAMLLMWLQAYLGLI